MGGVSLEVLLAEIDPYEESSVASAAVFDLMFLKKASNVFVGRGEFLAVQLDVLVGECVVPENQRGDPIREARDEGIQRRGLQRVLDILAILRDNGTHSEAICAEVFAHSPD